MAIHADEVRHIARLARLELTEEEQARYAEQLSAILDHAARLQEIDTAHIPPTATVLDLQAPLRPDQPRPSLPLARVLDNAPQSEEDMFRVPRVLDMEP
jgi:aspartyl-tRNA(Asn)/glutamyl-tRNA(Gln) amidotransferase subunit C